MTHPAGEFDDPFMPHLPCTDEIGRLFATGRLEPGWQCRWCPALLSTTPGGALLCLHCDTNSETR